MKHEIKFEENEWKEILFESIDHGGKESADTVSFITFPDGSISIQFETYNN